MSGKENLSDDSPEAKQAPRRSTDGASFQIGGQAERGVLGEKPSLSSKQPSSPLVLRSIDLAAIGSPARDADNKSDFSFTQPKSADAKLQSTSSATGAPTPRFKMPHQKIARSSPDQSKPPKQRSGRAGPKAKPTPDSNLRQNADTFRPTASSFPKASTQASQQSDYWSNSACTSDYTYPSNAYQPAEHTSAYNFTSNTSVAYPHQQNVDPWKYSGYIWASQPAIPYGQQQNQHPIYYSGYEWPSYPTLAYSQQQHQDPRYYSDYNWASMQFAYPEQQCQYAYYSTKPYCQSSAATLQSSSYPYQQQNAYPHYQYNASNCNQVAQSEYAPGYHDGEGYYAYYHHPANRLPAHAAYHGCPDGGAYAPQPSQAWSCSATYPQSYPWNKGYNPAYGGFQVQLIRSCMSVS